MLDMRKSYQLYVMIRSLFATEYSPLRNRCQLTFWRRHLIRLLRP